MAARALHFLDPCEARIARLRGFALLMAAAAAADWSLKACRLMLWPGWVAHHTSRPLLAGIPVIAGAALTAWYASSRLAMAGAALLAAGVAANSADVAADGVAWNMIPLGVGGLWCNLADLMLFASGPLMIAGVLRSSGLLGGRGAAASR